MQLPSLPVLGAVWGVSECGLAFWRRSESDARSRDRHSLWLILFVDAVSIGAGILVARRVPAFGFPLWKVLNLVGLCLFASGLLLRWYSIVYLGRFFTTDVAIAEDHRLIDTGPYRVIRHPSYLGAMLAFLGFSLGFANWASFVIIIAPIFSALLWRIQIEEAALTEALGERYRSYVRRTKRLIPSVY